MYEEEEGGPVEEGESWNGFTLSPLWGVKEELGQADEAYQLARLQEGGGR